MTYVIMGIVLIGSMTLQMALPAVPFLAQATFPFLLAVVMYYALNRDLAVMLVAAFCAGFLVDVQSPVPLGTSSFCFCAAGLITGCFRNVIVTEAVSTQAFFGAIMGCTVTFVVYLMLAANGYLSCPVGWAMLKVFGVGVLSAICTPVVYFIVANLDRYVGNVDVPEEVPSAF